MKKSLLGRTWSAVTHAVSVDDSGGNSWEVCFEDNSLFYFSEKII